MAPREPATTSPSASASPATFPREADGTPDPLPGLAGQALYAAKRLGRDSLPVPGRIARKSASPNTAEAVARPSPIG